MGTRADFYVDEDEKLTKEDWVGSIAWDGYPEGIDKEVLEAKTKEEFLKALKKFVEGRNDFTKPEEGWPWPWEDSGTTDYAYIFDGKKVHWDSRNYPDMSSIKRVQMGKKSGLIVISSKGMNI